MSCMGFCGLVVWALIAKCAYGWYMAKNHPETFERMRQREHDKRARRAKVFDVGLGVAKVIGKRKGWW